MNIILASLVIVVTVGNRASVGWVTIEDFNPSELVNLTPQKEHELMLQKLTKNSDGLLTTAFYYEILANSIGNSFFHFQQDTNTIRVNNAIIRAMIEGVKKLLMQHQVMNLLMNTVSRNGVEYVRTFNSLPVAFSLVCGDIDYSLKNETFYSTLRDEIRNQTYSPPNKIYHYGIAKSWKDEIRAVERLLNEPKIKHLHAHLAWMWIIDSPNSTLKEIKNSVTHLAKVPDKSEEIQTIYERSVDEVLPLMKRINISVALPGAKSRYFDYLQFNLTKTMWGRIVEEIPDWKDYFECDTTDGDNGADTSPIQLIGSGRCGKTQVGKDSIFKSAWPVTSDFGPFELQNLTLKEEHDIFLKKLVSNHLRLTPLHVYLEVMAKGIGNDFFGLIKDEKSNVRNNAIVKAAFECISNLKLQNHALEAISMGMRGGYKYVARTGDITQRFINVCSNIDNKLKHETFYTTKRDEYMKQNLSKPKKTYQYSTGKPTDDQRKIVAELFNDNLAKKNMLHATWALLKIPNTRDSEVEKTKFSILELVKVPSKSEAVQKIYEQSIEESVPIVRNFTYNNVIRNVESPTVAVAQHDFAESVRYVNHITKLMVSKINERPDLEAIFKAIRQQYEISIAEPTTETVKSKKNKHVLFVDL